MISAFRPFKVHSNWYQENQTPYTATRERNIIVSPITNNREFSSGIGNNQAPISPISLYLINPTSLVKPHALQHLTLDAVTYDIDIIVATETWMKAHHSDQAVDIPGYNIFRRDRKKRRGGGVAVYARREFNGRMLNFSEFYDDNIELIWISLTVHGRSCYVGAVYHPPKSIYPLEDIHSALERSLEDIFSRDEDSLIILAGDFNQLPSTFITSIGLIEVFLALLTLATIWIAFMLPKMYTLIAELLIHLFQLNTRRWWHDVNGFQTISQIKLKLNTNFVPTHQVNMLHCCAI